MDGKNLNRRNRSLNNKVTNTFTATQDLDIWNVCVWVQVNAYVNGNATYDIKMYVNNVRWI